MSKTETILTRMMSDSNFADTVFADAEMALAEYDLHPAEFLTFKDLSRAQYSAMTTNPEVRQSFSLAGQTVQVRFRTGTDSMQ